MATREAYGVALAKLGEADSRVVALDADVKNSTFSDKFEKAFPDRFYENYIAEQVMVGAAMARGARGYSFSVDLRVLPVSCVRFHPYGGRQQRRHQDGGSHAGVSISEDGLAMALEDLAMCRAQPNITVIPVRRRQHGEAGYVDGLPRACVNADEPPQDAGHLQQRRDVLNWRAESAAGELERRRVDRRRRRHGVRGLKA